MRIAFVADIHAWNHRRHGGPIVGGLNTRAWSTLRVIARAIDVAKKWRADAFVVLGDLLDGVLVPPQLVGQLHALLVSAELPVVLLAGNHEQHTGAPGDNSLAVFAHLPCTTVVDQRQVLRVGGTCELLLVPNGYPLLGDDFPPAAAGVTHRVCGVHCGVRGEDTPAYLTGGVDHVDLAAWSRAQGARQLFAGDWHTAKDWDGVSQLGALCPTGWDNPGLDGYGRVAIYDTEKGQTSYASVPGPRFVKAESPEVATDAAERSVVEGYELYLQLVAAPGQLDSARNFLASLNAVYTARDGGGGLVASELISSTDSASLTTRKAAHVARSASSLESAIDAWVAVQVPETDRATISALARKFLYGSATSQSVIPAASAISVRRLRFVGFLSHADTSVELAARGVILVTGPNGAGKSTVVEALAFCLWGKTLRGSPPWSGDSGWCEVVLDGGLTVIRRQVKPKTGPALTWGTGDPKAWATYETVTKAQEALERVIGSFELWRRSAVFSSSDALLFSGATDGERKHLVERVLGIDRFDDALKACRLGQKRNEADLGEKQRTFAVLEERLRGIHQRLADVVGSDEVPPGVDQAEVATLQNQWTAAKAERERLKRDPRVEAALGEARALAHAARAASDRLSAGRCPSCGQDIPKHLHDAACADLERREKTASEAALAAAAARQAYDETAARLDASIKDLNNRLYVLNEQERTHEASKRSADKARAAIDAATAQLGETTEELASVRERCLALQTEAEHLAICERALGLKGVRASLLGGALQGLQATANAWLSRLIGRPLTVTLVDSASGNALLDVEGAGGGHGYRGASQGERRRIDVALLLALGEFASAATGQEDGLLVLDEVLDALDKDGVDRACLALESLGERRQVLVVSHLEELTSSLRADVHLHVSQGTVVVR